VEIKNLYVKAGSFPSDAVLIDDTYFTEFSGQAPVGKMRGTGPDNLPAWVDPTEENKEAAGILPPGQTQTS